MIFFFYFIYFFFFDYSLMTKLDHCLLCSIYYYRRLSNYMYGDGIVVVVALLFYVHGKHLRSCRDGQLT